jgi:hypothetical protein
MPLYSGLKNMKINLIDAWFVLASCLACSSTLKMKAICSSETSVDFHRATRCYIPQDKLLHSHRCDNLKPKAKLAYYLSKNRIFKGLKINLTSTSYERYVWCPRSRMAELYLHSPIFHGTVLN